MLRRRSLPAMPWPIHQRRDELTGRGPAAISSHVHEEVRRRRELLYQFDVGLLVDAVSERWNPDIGNSILGEPTPVGSLGQLWRARVTGNGAVNHHVLAIGKGNGDFFRKETGR